MLKLKIINKPKMIKMKCNIEFPDVILANLQEKEVIPTKEIQQIITDFEKSDLVTLELEFKDVKLSLSKNKEVVLEQTVKDNVITQNENEINQVIEEKINLPEDVVTSPLVGTFYAASDPDAKPFVTVGERVEEGDVVCIVEAMKIMNEITSNVSGIVEQIHFENGDVVSYKDTLITVVKDGS